MVDDLLVAKGNRVVLSEAKYRRRINWKKVTAPIEAQLRWNATFPTLDVSIELVVPSRDQERALLSSPDAIAGVLVERFACDMPSSEYLRGCFFAERSDAASLENLIDLVMTAWLRRGMQASVYNVMEDARTKSFNKVLSLKRPYDLNDDEKKLLATFDEMKFEIRIDQLSYSHREHAIWTCLPFPLGSSAWHALVDELKLASPRNFIQFGKIAGRIWEATNAS
ncbi:MAG: hypothetical protein KJ947_11070 [Alphaproteobacteria bacterium]|nr:hypothetical protein [Alphaproteobacteria bacterium]MBU1550098.1 hypothetical protein [Alphaproteobacteria bacterium]MBU2337100.1 hypothetical protein [Alphaproteobacteria bacterium]MBU2389431.1 hypothetical protein [Alphaproteobacteria bacterium]